MIELNFLDANGSPVLSFQTLGEINTFFLNSLNISNPRTLLMDLMERHMTYNYSGNIYYLHKIDMSNTNNTISIRYSLQ